MPSILRISLIPPKFKNLFPSKAIKNIERIGVSNLIKIPKVNEAVPEELIQNVIGPMIFY